MMGPRIGPTRARRPPNLYIANPDSGSEESGDDRVVETRSPPAHPTLTLITQPPTPAVVENPNASVGNGFTSSKTQGHGSSGGSGASSGPTTAVASDLDRLSPAKGDSDGVHFQDPFFHPQELWTNSSGSVSCQTKPKIQSQTSSSSAGSSCGKLHDPPGTSSATETPRAGSEGSIRAHSRPDRPLPIPSSPPSIPLPQPPVRHRHPSSTDSATPLLSSGFASVAKPREPPLLHHHSSGSSSVQSPEIKRPLPPVECQYSPVPPSPASSGSVNRPSFSVPHPLPSLPIHAAAATVNIPKLANVRLQVTTDNENFSVVDVSNVTSSEAIMDRVFSKLRFRDDDHPTLSLYRTDIGEAPDPKAVPSTQLFNLCQNHGDSKGSLKFLVMQTALPHSTSSSAVPPPVLGSRSGQTPDFESSPASHKSRGTASVSSADNHERTALRTTGATHAKDGSFSSSSELMLGRAEYSSPTPIEVETELRPDGSSEAGPAPSLSGKPSLVRNARMVSHSRRRLPSTASTSRSSRSPADENVRNFAHLASSPPPSFGMVSSPSQSSATSMSNLHQSVDLTVPASSKDRRGSVTPTMPPQTDHMQAAQAIGLAYLADPSDTRILHGYSDPFVESPPIDLPGPSDQQRAPPSSARGDGESWLTSPSEPTEADLAVIAKLEEEERDRERREKIQLEEDMRVAMLEQQKEHEVWEQMQVQEREARQRQVEADRAAAEFALQQERERAAQSRREIERAERERALQVGKERKERRLLWENRLGAQGKGALDVSAPGWSRHVAGGAPDPGDLQGLSTLASRHGGDGISPTSPLDSRNHYESAPPPGPGPSTMAYRQQSLPRSNSPYDAARFTPPTATPPPRERTSHRTETHPQPIIKGYPYDGRGLAINGLPRQPSQPPPQTAEPRIVTGRRSPVQRDLGGSYDASRQRQPPAASRLPSGDYNIYAARSVENMRRSASASTGFTDQTVMRPDALQPTIGTAYLYREDHGRYPQLGSESDQGYARQVSSGSRAGPRPGPAGARQQGSRPNLHQQGSSADTRDPYDGSTYRPSSSGENTLSSGTASRGQAMSGSMGRPLDFPQPMPYNVHSRRGSQSSAQMADTDGATVLGSASHGSLPGLDDEATNMLDGLSIGSQLAPPSAPSTRSSRSGTTGSAGSSVMSTATMRPPQVGRYGSQSEDDSGDTARAGDWAQSLGNMLQSREAGGDDGTVRPGFGFVRSQLPSPEYDDTPEETLWFTPPVRDGGGASRDGEPLSSPGRPTLRLDTQVRAGYSAGQQSSQPPSTGTNDAPTSTTDSEANEDMGAKVRRHRSFAKNKDQWNFRPPAEHVYDNLEEFFPKIDLDKPVVDAVIANPHIEEPSPKTVSPDRPYEDDQSTYRVPSSARPGGFNKLESRKSIRFVAEGRKKHLSKIAPVNKAQQTSLERKRSSSMWGHRVVEVTPSKLKSGNIPATEGGNAAQTTMTWVKGELIGKGTYGRVYLALNVTTGDMIAVKQVEMPRTDRDREDTRQTGMIEALKSEIALLKDLDHPNVVTYLGWEESSRYLSIFLEYVPGGSIASVYRRHKKFEEGVIKSFTRQILEGLAYLHSLHILHRDLKADNVLVDTNGICKISDFGISKRTDDAYDSIVSTNLKGSVFWMAPEVVHSVKGQGYSAKVDIWSLGCVVLEMWAGRRPWGDMEALAAMFQLANKRAAPPVPDDVVLSQIADDFLNNCCFASNPHDRPTAVELLKHRFITDVDPNWTFATSGIGRAVVAGIKR